MKLVNQEQAQWRDRAHFYAVAAQAIRRILIDHARSKRRVKRGGGSSALSLEDAPAEFDGDALDLLALDDALSRLAQLHARQARVVELRFFGGLTLDEVAETLQVAPSTIDDDWAMARAWLRGQLGPECDA